MSLHFKFPKSHEVTIFLNCICLPMWALGFKPWLTCLYITHIKTMILPVFQDRIYWTDRDRAAVFMANRLTGQDFHTLAENLNDPHDIVVFHQLRQPQGVCTLQHEWGRLCMCVCTSVRFPPLAAIVWAESHLCDQVSSVGPCRPRHMNKWCWGLWLWWRDQSMGSSSTSTHLSKLCLQPDFL